MTWRIPSLWKIHFIAWSWAHQDGFNDQLRLISELVIITYICTDRDEPEHRIARGSVIFVTHRTVSCLSDRKTFPDSTTSTKWASSSASTITHDPVRYISSLFFTIDFTEKHNEYVTHQIDSAMVSKKIRKEN